MRRLLRRVFNLGVLSGLGYAIYRLISGQDRHHEDGREPSAPPTPAPGAPTPRPEPPRTERAGTSPQDTRPSSGPKQPAPATVRSIGVGEVPGHVPKWIDPLPDGSAPDTHPVKANMDSGIFHLPGGAHYDRVSPDRCYRDAESAEADGLRPSKQ